MQTCPSLYCQCESKVLKSHSGTRDVGIGALPSMQSKTMCLDTRTPALAHTYADNAVGFHQQGEIWHWESTTVLLLTPSLSLAKNKASGAFTDAHVCRGESVWLTPMLPCPSAPGSVVQRPCQMSVSVRFSSANSFPGFLSSLFGLFITSSNPQL